MAKFKRKERGLKIEFGNKVFNIDVADPNLSKKMVDFGNKASDKEAMDKLSQENVGQFMIDFYESILGNGAYEEIKKEVFEGEEPIYEDLLDIGFFLIEEINNYGASVDEENKNRMKLAGLAKK